MKTLHIAMIFLCVAFANAFADIEGPPYAFLEPAALDDPAYPLFDFNREKRQLNLGLGVGPVGLNIGVGSPYYGRPYYNRPGYYGYNNYGYNNHYGGFNGHRPYGGGYRPYGSGYYY